MPATGTGLISMQSNLVDPWDNPYNYRYPGQHRTYDIFSNGADGSPGGEGY
jgi:general secretion pathway protein G